LPWGAGHVALSPSIRKIYFYYQSSNLTHIGKLAAHVAKQPSFGSFNFLTLRSKADMSFSVEDQRHERKMPARGAA